MIEGEVRSWNDVSRGLFRFFLKKTGGWAEFGTLLDMVVLDWCECFCVQLEAVALNSVFVGAVLRSHCRTFHARVSRQSVIVVTMAKSADNKSRQVELSCTD